MFPWLITWGQTNWMGSFSKLSTYVFCCFYGDIFCHLKILKAGGVDSVSCSVHQLVVKQLVLQQGIVIISEKSCLMRLRFKQFSRKLIFLALEPVSGPSLLLWTAILFAPWEAGWGRRRPGGWQTWYDKGLPLQKTCLYKMPQEVQNLFRAPRTRSHSKTTLANKGVKKGQKASGKWRLRALPPLRGRQHQQVMTRRCRVNISIVFSPCVVAIFDLIYGQHYWPQKMNRSMLHRLSVFWALKPPFLLSRQNANVGAQVK